MACPDDVGAGLFTPLLSWLLGPPMMHSAGVASSGMKKEQSTTVCLCKPKLSRGT